MTVEVRFLCSLANGLHARPASMLADAVRPLDAVVRLKKIGGAAVDARSVLSIVALDVKLGDECIVEADGSQAAAALAAAKALIAGGWARAEDGHIATAPPQSRRTTRTAELPRGLRDQGIAFATGNPACAGVATGVAVFISGLSLSPEMKAATPRAPEVELADVTRAFSQVAARIRARGAAASRPLERDLLAAHAQIAEDPSFLDEVCTQVHAGRTAAQAVVHAANHFMDQLRKATSTYVRDRVIDIQDVAMQVVAELSGAPSPSTSLAIDHDAIVFADVLTPSQLMQLDRKRLKGLVLGSVGATSHTVILARSLSIPTLLDAFEAPKLAKPGDPMIIDADRGLVLHAALPIARRFYDAVERTKRRRRDRLDPIAKRPGATSDGTPLEVAANASTAPEVAVAIDHGAQGVGLLRTELLFLDRATPPTEDEQFAAYSEVVDAAAGRSVIIRTLDIGGDKPAAYMSLPEEENPFLGYRGIRLYPQFLELLHTQLRAILRASARGPVKIMAPMVSIPSEAAWFKAQVCAAQRRLADANVPFDPTLPIGIMVEVPSVAFAIEEFSNIVDFFSIGTNDLCQYWMAVDRGNIAVAPLYNARQPSFLRLLAQIIQSVKRHGKWIGMCGEMASDRRHLPLLVALGLDEISVAPGEVLNLKASLANLTIDACRTTLNAAIACSSSDEVDAVLAPSPSSSSSGADGPSVLDLAAIVTASDAQTKHEAIREAVDALYVAGRSEQPDLIEDAAWAREATYSTGLGYGFAIPHCKTDGISCPSLAVVKLREPVEWGSNDGQPVSVVLLLAVPASDTAGSHMKVFAKLARKLMHDDFRERLLAASEPHAIFRTLHDELQL